MLELLLRSKEKQEQLAQLTVPAARHAADALDKVCKQGMVPREPSADFRVACGRACVL